MEQSEQKKMHSNPSEIESIIRTRRSVRLYKKDDVPDEIIEKLINLANWAPSGMNAQPWKFVVIKDKNLINEMRKTTEQWMKFTLKVFTRRGIHWKFLKILFRIFAPGMFRTIDPRVLQGMKSHTQPKGSDVFHHAPVVIAILGNKGSSTAMEDCSAAAQNFSLAAHALGLGTCWIGFAEKFIPYSGSLLKKMGINRDWFLAVVLVLGIPATDYTKEVERNEPEIVWFK